MRTCSQCGRSGHNKRTCTGKLSEPTPETKVRRAINETIDAETQEAIDWYLEQRYPGYIAARKLREAAAPVAEEE